MATVKVRSTSRPRQILSGCIVAVMAALFVYVLARFPDAPVHKCVPGTAYAIMQHPDGYCGKQGQPRTADDYDAYKFWATTLFVVWPAGIASLAALRYVRRKPRPTAENARPAD